MADDLEERIRRRAHRLWEQDGKPFGREMDHWDKARELVAIEDNQRLTTIPVEESEEAVEGQRQGEPARTLENLGEFPTLTDQGEQQIPRRGRVNRGPID